MRERTRERQRFQGFNHGGLSGFDVVFSYGGGVEQREQTNVAYSLVALVTILSHRLLTDS